MNRFSDKYAKPELIVINGGLKLGWSDVCTAGHNPSTGSCGIGAAFGTKTGGDGFIDPEVLNQTERRSNILTD